MENTVSTFILVVATLLIGLVALGLFAFYFTQQYNLTKIQDQAENIANGLYITVSKNVTINGDMSLYLTVNDFNYQGSIFFTVFYVPNIYKNDTQYLTPQFAYMSNGQIIYPQIKPSYSEVQVSTLYYTNLNLLYQGSVTLWEIPNLSSPVPIVLILSPPQGYSAIILFFAQIQNKYIEVGYEWL